MLNKHLILFIISVVCGGQAHFQLGETCVADETIPGVCSYVPTCKFALEKLGKFKRPTICSYDNNTPIICCPNNRETGILNRFFTMTEGFLSNGNMKCHYDGELPMSCCPINKEYQPVEPDACPRLPQIPTPAFNNATLTVAWEKCVANEKFIHVCYSENGQYKRRNTCAVSESEQRISGGKDAEPREFPHMAVLGCNNGIKTEDNDIAWVGGGSLISDKYILTAGHVLISSTHGQLRYALLGTLNKTDIRSGDLYTINRLIPHKKYSSASKHYDIALVELARLVVFSEFIRPICLPVPDVKPESEVRLIAGWGESGHKADTTTILQKAIVYVTDGKVCKSTLILNGFVWNDDLMICAKGEKNLEGWSDTCQGDSGGPLMYTVTNKDFKCNYVLDGVVSWGGVCAKGEPASYTRVAPYLDWIVETIWPKEFMKASGLDTDIFADV